MVLLKYTITMKARWVWEMIGKTFVGFRSAKIVLPMLFMVPLKVVLVYMYMLLFGFVSLRNRSVEEPYSDVSEARISTLFKSKNLNTTKHINDEGPEEDNPSETGFSITIDDLQARVNKPSENGKQVNLKLKLIFMVESPIIFAVARLAIVEWTGLFSQWEQLYIAAVDPSLGYKVENKGVLEETIMLKTMKLQNRNFLFACGVLQWKLGLDQFLFG